MPPGRKSAMARTARSGRAAWPQRRGRRDARVGVVGGRVGGEGGAWRGDGRPRSFKLPHLPTYLACFRFRTPLRGTNLRHQPQAPPRNALMPCAEGCRRRARQSFPGRRGAASWKLPRCVVAVARVAAACCMWAAGKKARARSRQAKPTRQRPKHTPHAAANTAAQPSSPPDTSGFRARGRSPLSSIDARPPPCLSRCPAPPTPACSSRDIRSKCSPPAFEHSRDSD